MRLDTRITRLRKTILAYLAVGCGVACLVVAIVFGVHVRVARATAISEEQLDKFAQNNILFYDPSGTECISRSSLVCGNTAIKKYWSAFRKYFDEAQTAGVIGNMFYEGSYNPVSWEAWKVVDGSGNFYNGWNWDRLYNECDSSDREHSCGVGVGALGITAHLSDYLHFVNEEAPDLIKYFQNPNLYSFNYAYRKDGKYPDNAAGLYFGDQALEVIGETDFNRLVELEVRFVMEKSIGPGGFYGNMFDMDKFKSFNSAYEAGRYWASHYERCSECHLEATLDKRGRDAEAKLGLLNGFSCSGSGLASGSSAPSVIDTGITLIGDSISVMSENKLKEKFPNAVMTMVGSRHPTSRGICAEDSDKGGLGTLQVLASGSGVVAVQHQGQTSCETIAIDSSSLKKNVIWELGTNTTGANRDTIEKVIELVGENRNLYLVTPFNNNSNLNATTDSIADMYRDVAGSYGNVYVIDWNKAVRDNVSKYLDSGGYHPSADGSRLLADLIAEAIVSSGNDVSYSVCGGIDTSGGLNEKQIERLRDYYNGSEVDAEYWTLPHGKKNCVSFSAFFVQRFTSIGRQPHRGWGYGKDVAHLIAQGFNLAEGNEPRPFAVFSTYDRSTSTTGWGHTGVIVAVDGDDIITLEASYNVHDAKIEHRTIEFFYNTEHSEVFTYLDSILNKSDLLEVVGR